MITINNNKVIAFSEWLADVRGLVKNIVANEQSALNVGEEELSVAKRHIVQARQTKASLTQKSVK